MSPWFLITVLLTVVGGAAGLFYPFYGLLAYIALSLLRPESLWFWSVPEWNYSRVVAIALLIGWLIERFARWRERYPELGVAPLAASFAVQPLVSISACITGRRLEGMGRERYMLGALLVFSALTIFGAVTAPRTLAAWSYVETMAKIVVPFFVGMSYVDTSARLKQLAWVMLGSEGYVCFDLNRDYLRGWNRLAIDGFGGMDNNCATVGFVTVLGVGIILTLESPRLWQKGLAGFLTALIGHAILISLSRGGMLGALLAGTTAFVVMKKKAIHYALAALAVAGVLYTTGETVRQRFLMTFEKKENRDESAQSRLVLWGACLDCISEHPVLGVGPNHWPLIVSRYGWPEGKEAHTLWLQLGAELGLPALACLVLFFALGIVQLWPVARGWLLLPDPWLQPAAQMTISGLVGFMFSAQFVTIKSLEIPYFLALVGAGTLRLASKWETA
jgi:O-antigen ligase